MEEITCNLGLAVTTARPSSRIPGLPVGVGYWYRKSVHHTWSPSTKATALSATCRRWAVSYVAYTVSKAGPGLWCSATRRQKSGEGQRRCPLPRLRPRALREARHTPRRQSSMPSPPACASPLYRPRRGRGAAGGSWGQGIRPPSRRTAGPAGRHRCGPGGRVSTTWTAGRTCVAGGGPWPQCVHGPRRSRFFPQSPPEGSIPQHYGSIVARPGCTAAVKRRTRRTAADLRVGQGDGHR